MDSEGIRLNRSTRARSTQVQLELTTRQKRQFPWHRRSHNLPCTEYSRALLRTAQEVRLRHNLIGNKLKTGTVHFRSYAQRGPRFEKVVVMVYAECQEWHVLERMRKISENSRKDSAIFE